ncbi:Hypothetical protein Minf_2413 [Methylacidiphilum infernorum V4]|uniref:Uncharacterized protein n=1 Tax=Methylacidiphilum infernorum (isolate V4) TaxID=481448 RepID=B3E0Z0_METI4|nr:Hypothetical protein Minf_2413 [Methylacidiphilum infernorum V4]
MRKRNRFYFSKEHTIGILNTFYPKKEKILFFFSFPPRYSYLFLKLAFFNIATINK